MCFLSGYFKPRNKDRVNRNGIFPLIKRKSSKPVSRILSPLSSRKLDSHHLSSRSTPRYRTGRPQAPVYVIFQPARRTAGNVTIAAGGLLLHLLTFTRRSFSEGGPSLFSGRKSFSSSLLCPREHLLFQKCVALCCPDFPPPLSMLNGGDRTVYCFVSYVRCTRVAPKPYSLKEASWYR